MAMQLADIWNLGFGRASRGYKSLFTTRQEVD